MSRSCFNEKMLNWFLQVVKSAKFLEGLSGVEAVICIFGCAGIFLPSWVVIPPQQHHVWRNACKLDASWCPSAPCPCQEEIFRLGWNSSDEQHVCIFLQYSTYSLGQEIFSIPALVASSHNLFVLLMLESAGLCHDWHQSSVIPLWSWVCWDVQKTCDFRIDL